ncbi:MAG: aminoglycoside 3'-phosphotransferase [Dehalococcoidia bacterium]|nr:aminoglycoside 3'-phosphotransferase [Dehalococcoidia bacterium]
MNPFFRIPQELEGLIEGYQWNKVTIGESTDSVSRLARKGRRTLYLKTGAISHDRRVLEEKGALAWLKTMLPIPRIVGFASDSEYDFLLTEALTGVNACAVPPESPTDLVRLLAHGLVSIHKCTINDCPLNKRLEVEIIRARDNLSNGYSPMIDLHGRSPIEAFEALLKSRPSVEDIVFTHGDYSIPNVMINRGRISGFVDWGRAGIADRYRDIALALKSIQRNLGPGLEQVFLQEYGIVSPDLKKIEFYKLINEFL